MSRRPSSPASPERIRTSHVEWTRERLTTRDWAIIETVNKIKLATGLQLERLHFSSLSGRSREVTRGRVLRRLVAWRVLVPLPRRRGGNQRGSSHSVFALDTAGQRLLAERQMLTQPTPRVRRPGAPGERLIRHTLAVTELYTALVETARSNPGLSLAGFDGEPACWWPTGLGGWLKPDAYLCLDTDELRAHWWVEIDLATEGLPTIQRKLGAYLDFCNRGQLGPSSTMPRVLVSVPSEQRRQAIQALVRRLPEPASKLFSVTTHQPAVVELIGVLRE